mgnify:CR=1 FL=1
MTDYILKTNVMEQFKRAQVIMLPTGSNLEFPYIAQNVFNKQLTIVNSTFAINCELQSQHLYIISDDEIKEGDWFINLFNNVIVQAHNWIYVSTCKKIIATTDTSLEIVSKGINPVYEKLPQPSQQFIEQYIESYNKGKVITDVLVELKSSGLHYFNEDLRINPKDNTIIIKKLKDSWNREEVIELMKKYCIDIHRYTINSNDFNKWIEENL